MKGLTRPHGFLLESGPIWATVHSAFKPPSSSPPPTHPPTHPPTQSPLSYVREGRGRVAVEVKASVHRVTTIVGLAAVVGDEEGAGLGLGAAEGGLYGWVGEWVGGWLWVGWVGTWVRGHAYRHKGRGHACMHAVGGLQSQ